MTTCYAHHAGSSLVLGNTLIERQFDLSAGCPRTVALIDKLANHTWHFPTDAADIQLPGESPLASNLHLQSDFITTDPIAPPHLRVTITYHLASLELRRIFRIYDNVPALASDLYLRGRPSSSTWLTPLITRTDNIEYLDKLHRAEFLAPSLDHLHFPHPHIALTAVQFFDRTDQRNTLVLPHHSIPYNAPAHLTGNILLGRDLLAQRGFVILKESPCSDIQLANPGCDFAVTSTNVRCVGIGVNPADLHPTDWTRAYGCVIALGPSSNHDLLDALRLYQHQLRPHHIHRDFQLLVNTWGDRNRDARMSESFILHELDAVAKLGATHLQLDDGWQTGTSPNSASAGGTHDSLGHAPDFWAPHPLRFPRGLQPLIDKANSLNIQIGLWFAPFRGPSGNYDLWQRDADILIALHHQLGIRVFKIDMVNITTKHADANLRNLFDKVTSATNGDVCFNLDATAGLRYGYHYFREFGHTFVENRYTDWVNYFPHRTLRNLWSLSRYLPPQSLQFEFLNIYRNADKYGSDPLAPANVPFAYCFALTMMSQPLAWFEASGLPPKAFDISPLIRTYRQHQPAIHAGRIHPVGDEPDGTAWPGFQSISSPHTGYLLILREQNNITAKSINLHNLHNRRLTLRAVAGDAADFTTDTRDDSAVTFSLPTPFSFGLWRYSTSS